MSSHVQPIHVHAVATAPVPATMTAVVQHRYGTHEQLSIQEVATPKPAKSEVLIRTHASSMNQADWLLMMGRPWPIRFVHGLLRPKKPVVGMDAAGVVVAVGEGVSRFKVGDEVFGEISGAMAQFSVGSETRLALKPNNLSFEQAAAVPIAGVTALQGLRDARPGARVLITGASGGVGTFAVQIAKSMGAEVTAVCSTRNLDLVRSIGADHVVDYAKQAFTDTASRYDIIFDVVGAEPLRACQRILAPGGVYVSSVGRLSWVFKALLASVLPGPSVRLLAAQPTVADLEQLTRLIESGQVTPVIDQRYTLGDAKKAFAYQGEGHTRGKSVFAI